MKRKTEKESTWFDVKKAMCPCLEDKEQLDIEGAEEVINQYAKDVNDIKDVVELMIFFVECGNDFIANYENIDDDLSNSLLAMYGKSLEAVMKLSGEEKKQFKNRLYEILDSVPDVGWRYNDDLSGLYYKSFPDIG